MESNREMIANIIQNWKTDDVIEESIVAYAYYHRSIDIAKNFPLYIRGVWLKTFLAHYQLFLKTQQLAGDIVELGIFRGRSLMSLAHFLEIHNMGDRHKQVFGFDNWQGLKLTEKDGAPQEGKKDGNYNASQYKQELLDIIKVFDADRLAPHKPRIVLVDGNIEETVPKFIADHPGLRISLIHFDCDTYEPTMTGLKYLYPLVVTGGVVMFDEYGLRPWEGESKAVDDYFQGKQKLNRFNWVTSPAGWIVKGEE